MCPCDVIVGGESGDAHDALLQWQNRFIDAMRHRQAAVEDKKVGGVIYGVFLRH